jgi:hypothetical protein
MTVTFVAKHTVPKRITLSGYGMCRFEATGEEATVLFLSRVFSVGTAINFCNTFTIKYTEISITFWKYDTGFLCSPVPICKCKWGSENVVLYEIWTVFLRNSKLKLLFKPVYLKLI